MLCQGSDPDIKQNPWGWGQRGGGGLVGEGGVSRQERLVWSGLLSRTRRNIESPGSARPRQIDLSGEKDFSDVWLPRILRNPRQPVSSKPRWWRAGNLLGQKTTWKPENRTSRDYVDEFRKKLTNE